jgi:hypothetical protein
MKDKRLTLGSLRSSVLLQCPDFCQPSPGRHDHPRRDQLWPCLTAVRAECFDPDAVADDGGDDIPPFVCQCQDLVTGTEGGLNTI